MRRKDKVKNPDNQDYDIGKKTSFTSKSHPCTFDNLATYDHTVTVTKNPLHISVFIYWLKLWNHISTLKRKQLLHPNVSQIFASATTSRRISFHNDVTFTITHHTSRLENYKTKICLYITKGSLGAPVKLSLCDA